MSSAQLTVNSILDYAARCHGDQEVLSYSVEGPLQRHTYAEVHRRSQLCALALKASGVRRGSTVATLAWNTGRHMECWYGIMGLGAVCHTVNPRLFDKDLEYIITHAKDEYVMLDLPFVGLMERMQKSLPSVKGYIVLADRRDMPLNATLHNMICYEDMLQAQISQLPFKWEVNDENLACGLCYTSGTTGRPKGILYSHRSSYLHTMLICFTDHMGLSSSSCIYAMAPMFHGNAWSVVFSAPMVGAHLILPGPVLTGERVFGALEEHRATLAFGVPTVFANLAEYMRVTQQELHHLKLIFAGGSPCPLKLIEAFDRMGVEVRQVFGMTEMLMATVGVAKGSQGQLSKEDTTQIRLSQGRPHHMTELRIVGECKEELPWDGKSAGEVEARGPLVMQAYFGHERDAVNEEGWLPTGDIAIS